ncbi:hypothetical protein GCM10010251_64220 [Streptomyces aurantiogriseus]|uniref:Uncharacterized protein n=1 Tax=Streptomyces aurantiogriseus TaxID=66870 RepID=A0A918KX63_9ACTN|nr:hypothetical protein GCM10010251_64220 [Streptomyces aurantiogriseus]
MEICIAVADWARGLMVWVLVVPGGEGTGATRRQRQRAPKHIRHKVYQVSPSGSTRESITRSRTGWTASGRGAGMVVGWG